MIDEKKIKAYGRAVMMRILADRETKKRMEREVLSMVRDRVFDSGRNDPYEVLGDHPSLPGNTWTRCGPSTLRPGI